MGRFQHSETGVVFSVDDSKDDRYTAASGLFQPATDDKPTAKKAAAKRTASDSDK